MARVRDINISPKKNKSELDIFGIPIPNPPSRRLDLDETLELVSKNYGEALNRLANGD